MSRLAKHTTAAALSGLLFGTGLVISGMTDPSKVLSFLDVFGHWSGSLIWVMGGAVCVHALGYRWVRRRRTPLFSGQFAVPTRHDVDAKLLVGAALFGVGWGLSGYCPGPSLVALVALRPGTLVFVAGLALGTWLMAKLETRAGRRSAQTDAEPAAAE